MVHAQSVGYAAVLAATFVVASCPSVISQRVNVSAANVAVSSVRGGLVNLTTAGNSRGFATVTVDGRNKTVGATSAGADGINTTIIDFMSSGDPPMTNTPESDPTAGVPAPPVASPPNVTAPPGSAGEEGAARLVSRVDVNGFATGAVQVFCEGAWGTVCNSRFGERDAAVACRQLGFSTGLRGQQGPLFARRAPDPDVVAPFVLENLGCRGDEARLVDCPVFDSDIATPPLDYSRYDYFVEYSSPDVCDTTLGDGGTFARVACGTSNSAEEGDIRLANSVIAADGSAEYGRLEVFYNGGWGTVCDTSFFIRFRRPIGFNVGAADVACRQLGYQQGFQIQKLEDDDPASTARVPIVLAGLNCTGMEQSISGCSDFRLGRGRTNCRHDIDVHLVCSSGPNPEMDGVTRLVDGSAGPGYEYGRLEIFERGFWSNVCNNDRFTPDAAMVACRALGYGGGAALRFTQSYANSISPVLFENLPVALAAVDCEGTEASITDCQSNDRLIGLCTNITSSTVLACANSADGCDRQEGTTEGAVRLRGGFGTPCDPVHSGFIEVLHLGEWGSICTDRLTETRAEDNLVADVVCRQLGFPHGTRIDPLTAEAPRPSPPDGELPSPNAIYYDYGSIDPTEEAEEPGDRFWLSEVTCSGPEARLIDCDLGEGFRNNNAGCSSRPHRIHIACRQFPVVEALEEVTTPDAEDGDIRLVSEAPIANWMTGLLQVFFEGSWSQVCNGFFDVADANVACRQLGFGAGTVVPQFLSEADLAKLRSTPVFPEVAITASGCIGSEERLVDCGPEEDQTLDYRADFTFGRDCLNSIGAGLRIACVASPGTGSEGAFRITDTSPGATPDSESGVLEVFHAGAWGTLCEGDFGDMENTAEVACRDIGFVTGFLQDEVPTAEVLPPWLSGISCAGQEAEVGACRRSVFGDTSSCGSIQRLFCFSTRQRNGRARLVGGSADEGGAWEYGRLEVLVNSIWSFVEDSFFSPEQDFGRRGAQVACRSLGFAAGAQLLVGDSSPFPSSTSSRSLTAGITCDGSETSLADCDINIGDHYRSDYAGSVLHTAVALICSNPSGCEALSGPPAEGDVRLVPLNGTAVPTAVCDDVHFGGVELFHEGTWGRICAGRFRGDLFEFTLDAQVVCRQLGFPFGTLMDNAEVAAYDYTSPEYSDPPVIVWATEVVCTGKEERLLDCDFPEDFGADSGSEYYTPSNDYFANLPDSSHAAPESAPMGNAPASSRGLSPLDCDLDIERLSVICRRFEITESDTIRR